MGSTVCMVAMSDIHATDASSGQQEAGCQLPLQSIAEVLLVARLFFDATSTLTRHALHPDMHCTGTLGLYNALQTRATHMGALPSMPG
jgi:hypothetical protein